MNELLSKYSHEIAAILAKYPPERKASALMPLLHLAQRETGYVSAQDRQDIAGLIGVSLTDIDSVVGFYTLFHPEPGGRYRIQVCTDLPCALRGAAEFLEQLSAQLGIGPGETTVDGMFTLEEVTCLAACHRAPMFQVQGDGQIIYHEHQTVATAMAVVAELRSKAGEVGK